MSIRFETISSRFIAQDMLTIASPDGAHGSPKMPYCSWFKPLISILLVGYGLVGDGDLRSRKFQHQWMTDRYSRLEVSTSSPPSRDRARDLRGTVGSHLTMRLPVHFYE